MLVYLGATKDSHADNQRILHHTIGFCFVVAAFQVSDATYEEYKLFFWGFAAVVPCQFGKVTAVLTPDSTCHRDPKNDLIPFGLALGQRPKEL